MALVSPVYYATPPLGAMMLISGSTVFSVKGAEFVVELSAKAAAQQRSETAISRYLAMIPP
jgi:hypothetical protein